MRAVNAFLIVGLALSPLPSFGTSAQQSASKPPPAGAHKVRNPLNDLLDEAQAALDKKDYQAAIVALQKFIAEKPEVAFAHFQLAYAYTALQHGDEARSEYNKCISLDPKMAEAYLNLGILLLDASPAEAVSPLGKAVALLPSESGPRKFLGIAQQRSGDLEGAAESFEGASRLDPKDADTLIHLAEVYLKSNRPADAEKKFHAALNLEPNSPPALQGVALSLDAQKKPEALDAYRAYLAAQPQDHAARTRLIQLMVDEGQYEAAKAELERGGPSSTIDQLKLKADIEIGQKKYSDAIATLKEALRLAPNDAQLHGSLGRVYRQTSDYPNAERELKTALQIDGHNLAYWKDLSSTLYLAGNCQATLATLQVIAKAETLGAGAWFIRALCYDKLGDVQAALDAYRQFLALDDNKNPDQVWQANQRIHVLEKAPARKK